MNAAELHPAAQNELTLAKDKALLTLNALSTLLTLPTDSTPLRHRNESALNVVNADANDRHAYAEYALRALCALL